MGNGYKPLFVGVAAGIMVVVVVVVGALWYSQNGESPVSRPSPEVARQATATLAPTFTPTLIPTATPYPTYTLYPTYTPYPTLTPTPEPTATPIAVAPAVSADWPTTIRRAADALQGDGTALYAELLRLGAMTATEGMVRALDLTHDGSNDLIVWYVDPSSANSATRGNVLLLAHDGTAWRVVFDATFGTGSQGARLWEARDLNNDRQNELAYALTSCGANGCSTTMRVGVWAGSSFQNLTASEIRMPSLREATFTDGDGDGRFEMALTGGALETASAGPQRERTDIYGWAQGGYALQETVYAATDSLPLTVWEANAALAAGDLSRASTLYQRAVEDETLRPWAQGTTDAALADAERDLLRAFSRFRLVVLSAVQGNRTAAEAWLDGLQDAHPDSPFREAGDLFMEALEETNRPPDACRAVNEYVAANAATILDPLNRFGFTGPQFTAADICPLR